MAKYECKVCGYIYNEQHAGRTFEELAECPICNEGKENFVALDADNNPIVEDKEEVAEDITEAAEKPESNEEVAQENIDEENVTGEETEKDAEDITSVEGSFDGPSFVVERRQEFWTPLHAKEEKKEENRNTTGWTISNAMGSVEKVIGADDKEEDDILDVAEPSESIVDVTDEDDDIPAFKGRIESFYSSAEPVRTSHIVSGDDEEESFKPLWNSGGGTVQRVIDPFGDKNDSVVKAENVDMVMPAEEPVVREILGEEKEEVLTEVKEEFFFDDEDEEENAEASVLEEVKEDAEEMIEEFAFEDIKEEAAETEEIFAAEDKKESVEEFTEETAEEVEFDDAKEGTEEATDIEEAEDIEEAFTFEEAKEDLEDDEDFFTEMTLDAVMEPGAEREGASVSEEEVFQAIDAIVFDEDVPEGGRIEVVSADGTEEILFEDENVEAFDSEDVAEDAKETYDSETVEEEAFGTEDVAVEAEEAFDVEDVEEDEEAFVFEEAKVNEEIDETLNTEAEEVTEAMNADSEASDEVQNEDVDVAEESASNSESAEKEEPRIKAWSFLDDVVDAGAAVGVGAAGVNFVTKSMDEVVDEEVTEDDIEEVFVDFAQEKTEDSKEHDFKTNLAEELFAQDKAASETETFDFSMCDDISKEAITYCNNLEKILIVPAQLNPMPLPEGTQVEGRTVLGIASEKPLVLDNPVFSTGEYNMVQYIPNSGLTSEDYQQADAIEIIVGHGNGIEKTINSKEDLRQVVNFLRLESDGCPIGIKMGAARIERDLEFCVFAKPDYVVLNNFDVVPLPYALHRATKYLNTVQSDMDIVIALDGAKDAEELAKIMAMGADVIALRNRPDDMIKMTEGLKKYARITGHYDVEDLNVKDLCTVDREIAEYTDIYHV